MPKKQKNKLVGITIGIGAVDESLWVNGIKLNAAMLYFLINEVDGYEAIIVDTSDKIQDTTSIEFWDTKKIKTHKFSKVFKKLDVLIELGTSFTDNIIEHYKKQGLNAKIVKYHCGNNYVIEMERIIFQDENSPGPTWSTHQDQTWYVPQQHKHNHHYYSITSRGMAIPVPFVWDPYFLDLEKKKYEGAAVEYQPGDSLKRILSFEPNNNVVKYSMPLIMIAEEALRNGANFDSYTVCSGQKMFKNNGFRESLKNLDIYKQGKIKYLGRWPIVHILTANTDVVISHQWDNPLNYLYLDVMYFGYPLIHNADMVQDGGYYYKDFQMKDGAAQLKLALETHDNNLEQYRLKNAPVLNRYTKENKEIVDTYRKLLDNLFESDKHKLSYEYNWKTNNYEN